VHYLLLCFACSTNSILLLIENTGSSLLCYWFFFALLCNLPSQIQHAQCQFLPLLVVGAKWRQLVLDLPIFAATA
jgi:hypothetical protein